MSAHTPHPKKPYGYIKNMHLIEKAFFDPRLQNATKLLLALFVRYANADGQLERSLAQIGRRQGISRQAVQNQANKLIKTGYISRKINRNAYSDNGFNTYTLIHEEQPFTYPATQLGCPPATQLDCLPATPSDCGGATQLNCPKKTLKKEKEKNTHPRDIFMNEVKEEFQEHGFQEIGKFSEDLTNSQAIACWEHWEGTGEFPNGSYIASFKGWLRNGLHTRRIKETSEHLKNSNALQNVQIVTATNPIQDWHKKIEPIVGSDIFKSWMRQCWHDGNGKLCTPTKLSEQRIKDNYQNEIAKVLPNVTIVHQPYKDQHHDSTL